MFAAGTNQLTSPRDSASSMIPYPCRGRRGGEQDQARPSGLVPERESDGGIQQTETRDTADVWSGATFDEAGLNVLGKKFKDASVFFNHVSEIRTADLQRWLEKAREIQWDYKNLVRRKSGLERLR